MRGECMEPTENKWAQFAGDPEFRIVDLGRPAVFILPLRVLFLETAEGASVETDLRRFLAENFGAYTFMSMPSYGVWTGEGNTQVSDESRMYKVSFKGKGNIPLLARKLAQIARFAKEECIYLEAGQYSGLVYPE